jgi:long-chain fatty acid transport protein
VSIGAGLQIDYFDLVKLKAATPLGLSNLKGDDFGAGFTAGITARLASGTSIGLGFRSAIHHDVKGSIAVADVAKAPVNATIDLPEKTTLSIRQVVSPAVRLLGTVEWTNWSRLGVIPVVLDGPLDGLAPAGSTVANLDFGWRDGWLFALGGEYDASPTVTFRAGAAYEVSPVDDATTRLIQVPDSNRWWAGIGASWKWSDRETVDLAYNHIFYQDDAPFDRVPASTLGPQVHLLGTMTGSLDIISIGWRMRWGGRPPVAPSVK